MPTIYVKQGTTLPKRTRSDLYRSEPGAVKVALDVFAPVRAEAILDIGPNDGRWGRAAWALTGRPVHLVGVDERPLSKPRGFSEWYTADYLTWRSPRQYDLIVGNPPFKIAEAIVRKAITEDLAPGGRMILLLPLDFMASVGRYDGLWGEYPPEQVGIYSARLDFTGQGSGTINCAVYLWSGGHSVKPRQWQTILLPPHR